MNVDAIQTLKGIDALTKLSEWGFKFVLLQNRTKKAYEDGWQNKPHDLQKAIAHANSGQNVGALCGSLSQGLCMLDIDRPPVTYPDFCQKYPELAKTPTVFRRNAPHKAKLIFKIKVKPGHEVPHGKKWRQPGPEGKLVTVIEWLSTGNQGVVPPSLNTSGPEPVPVELKNYGQSPIELTATQLFDLWSELTGEDFLSGPAVTPAASPVAPADVNPLKLLKEYHEFINTRFPAQLARKLASQAADLLVVEGEYTPLKTLSIDEIMTTEWPPPVWAIPDLLPVGPAFLAGKPKLGKSWLLLQVARAVASGSMLFDKQVDEPGRVLYLALEDNARRLQDRIKKQGWDWRGLPIDFVTMAEFKNRMGSFLEGGAEALAKQIEESHHNLVIVDTLSRACFNDPNRNELMAATLAPVQELAMMTNTALLFVDHHNKSAGALMDAIGDILGGTSKGATLDTAWGLYRDRGKQEANLAITGRDVEDLNLALVFETKTGLWCYNGDYYTLKITERRQEYLDLIADLDGSVQVKEIAQNLGVTTSAARQQLSELVNAGHLRVSKKGRYVFYELI